MFAKSIIVAAALAGSAVAQRPSSVSVCDYYTTALLKNNTAANQKTLLTLLVNTVVIGNYTQPNVGVMVPGILAPGEVNGEKVNLAPYFTGALASTNTGGMVGVSVNFLDGGGAAPLKENKPANDNTSKQYRLLTHLYEFFGTLLGCSLQGGADYPAYNGEASQYEVHKFMALSNAEVTYFITQVGLAAASFGVPVADVTPVGMALASLFGVRCAPETTVIPAQGADQQSICISADCPLSPNATCSAYAAVVEPLAVNSTSSTGTASGTASATGSATGTATGSATATGTASRTASASGSAAATTSRAAASAGVVHGAGMAVIFGAVAAFFL